MRDRLEMVRKAVDARVKIVLHGTNDFGEEIMRRCVKGGVSKVNVNKLVLDGYLEHLKREASRLPLTQLMEEGVEKVVERMEWLFDVCGSTGKSVGTRSSDTELNSPLQVRPVRLFDWKDEESVEA